MPPITCVSCRATCGPTSPSAAWAEDTAVADLIGSGPYRLAAWRRGQFATLEADTTGGKVPRHSPSRVAVRARSRRRAQSGAESRGGSARVGGQSGTGPARRGGHDASSRALCRPPSTASSASRSPAPVTGPTRFSSDRATRRALARRHRPPNAGPLALRARGQGAAGADVAAALDLERQHRHDPVRHREGLRRAGGGGVARGQPRRSHPRRHAAGVRHPRSQHEPGPAAARAADAGDVAEGGRGGDRDGGGLSGVPAAARARAIRQPTSARGSTSRARGGWRISGPVPDGRRSTTATTPIPVSIRSSRGPIEPATSRAAKRLYQEAMDTLNADAPAIFLYAPANIAVVSRRIEGVDINPYGWVSGLPRGARCGSDGSDRREPSHGATLGHLPLVGMEHVAAAAGQA